MSNPRWSIRSFVLLAALSTALLLSAWARPPQQIAQQQLDVERGLRPAPRSWWKPSQQAKLSLTDRMAFHHVPGVSLAVIDGGRVAWARGYGFLHAGNDARVSTETLFQAASISKAVTATAAMMLVQDGRLSLDRPVNDTLRSWKVPAASPDLSADVTLRQLLSHTAGIGVPGYLGYPAGQPVPRLLDVLRGAAPATSPAVRVERPAGRAYAYSGGGYEVLQLLLQETGGEPFPGLMQRRLLQPLGMTHSTFTSPLPETWRQRAAEAHSAAGQPLPGRWHTYPELAAAGLWSTPSDLARWLLALSGSANAANNALLNQATMREMLTDHTPGLARWYSGHAYSLGLKLRGRGQAFSFGHTGINQGYRAVAVMYPRTGQGAVVMTNGENGEALAQEILRSVAAAYHWPDEPPGRGAELIWLPVASLVLLGLLRAYPPRKRGRHSLKFSSS
ncbi:serine hydrolase domain-containing protein [Deinococcus cavernae]|nr:serine hydrolase domain-containing protein [Deinococcus cavernae]